MAEQTLWGVVDTYGIELLHPIREGRHPAQSGRQGLSNHRWIVGVKLGVLLNRLGLVVGWGWAPDNGHDKHFAPLVEAVKQQMLVLADQGFHSAEGDPPNLKIGKRGQWNERMVIETMVGMLTLISPFKKVGHRVAAYGQARLAFTMPLFNILAPWHGLCPDKDTGFVPVSIAEFSL